MSRKGGPDWPFWILLACAVTACLAAAHSCAKLADTIEKAVGQ